MDEELVKKKIGKKEVDDAYARLQKYKEGKAALETRIVGAEEWWKNGSALTVNFATQMIPSQ